MLLLYTAFLLPLAVVPAAVFTRRQVLPVGASSDALEPLLTTLFGYDDPPILTPNKSWALKPRFRLDAKRKVVRWGPFELPAALKPNVGTFQILTVQD